MATPLPQVRNTESERFRSNNQGIFDVVFPRASVRRYIITRIIPITGAVCCFILLAYKVGQLAFGIFGGSENKESYGEKILETMVGFFIIIFGTMSIVGLVQQCYECFQNWKKEQLEAVSL